MTSPIPKQGIMEINPYVGGDAAVDGLAKIVKLSSNEGATGASPRAIERARGWWMTAALCGGVARPSPTEQSAGHSRRRRGVRDRLPTRITYHTLYYTHVTLVHCVTRAARD